MKHETRLRELEIVLQGQLEQVAANVRTSYPPLKPGGKPLVSLDMSGGKNGYKGIWPEDLLVVLNAMPSLITPEEAWDLLSFLTASVTGQIRCYNMVDENGHYQNGFSQIMAQSLPFWWICLAARLEEMSGKKLGESERYRWLQLFRRSLGYVNFSMGLVYILPDRPGIGYGYHDIVHITGFELMSSVMACRGFTTAQTFFNGAAQAGELADWQNSAEQISVNLFRLYDEQKGIFNAGSIDCRQPDIWGSGFASGLLDADRRKSVSDFIYKNRTVLFREGLTRQICEKEGWQKLLSADFEAQFPAGVYINGGYWSVGTGYVLPTLYEHYPDFALELLEEAVISAPKYCFAESISENGNQISHEYFVSGNAMLLLAVRAILAEESIYDVMI